MGNDGGAAGARAKGDVVEAHFESGIDGESTTEAHTAEHVELAAAFEEQADYLKEVLVPANGDAIFGDAAETGHDAFIEPFVDFGDVTEGAEFGTAAQGIDAGNIGRKGFDFEAVDGENGVAIIHQVMRKGEAGGTKANDQDFKTGGRAHEGAREMQGVPAREQAIDFEAPGEFQNVFERAGFDLRNIDRLLLLEDAAFHAVITDAVPGGGGHGVVNGDDGEGSDGIALALHLIHFGDFFVEGAAGQLDSEDAGFE